MAEEDPLLPRGVQRVDVSSYRDVFIQKQNQSQLLAIFVVTFDVKKGNTVSWQHPAQFDLSSVDFKAIPSGLHTLESDYVYFNQNDHFGLACFNRYSTNVAAERNARMCSVGIIMDYYEALYPHLNFLSAECRKQNRRDVPDHSDLITYFNQVASRPHSNSNPPVAPSRSVRPFATSFVDFWRFFGPSVFVLWRAMMLNLRILLYHQVPIGPLSNRVGWCRALLPESLWQWIGRNSEGACPALFYVSVADIGTVKSKRSFIACTSELIFKEKSDLWDVFVDGNGVIASRDSVGLRVTNADRTHYKKLNQRMESVGSEFMEVFAVRYFGNLSEHLRHRFTSGTDVYTSELSEIGLSRSDVPFLRRYARKHKLDVSVKYSYCCC
eukprot:c5784_g1_i1.p1 GENE.c5784_g1_i1~~c5784_g1_i1.p1  ORF type:complete len:382 (+),score=64.24 c5784_g1_i1:38-1183(+)